jgi:DNA-binding MarR family transcriptional regulator
MGEALKKRLKQQRRFQNPLQESLLNVIVAAGHIRESFDRASSKFGVTQPQYNVLRILRGAHPNGYSRYEIAERMLDRAPDVTRLIDRLEQQKLVVRDRSDTDRRLSITRITDKGIEILLKIAPELEEAHQHYANRLTDEEQSELSRLCELLYSGDQG